MQFVTKFDGADYDRVPEHEDEDVFSMVVEMSFFLVVALFCNLAHRCAWHCYTHIVSRSHIGLGTPPPPMSATAY